MMNKWQYATAVANVSYKILYMANNKNGNHWILILECMGCVIISTIAYVAMKAATKSEFLAITVTIAVAVVLCVCVWQVFTQLEYMVPKSERERLKAEKLAEEARRKQLAEVLNHEVSHLEQQQPQIVVQNTIVNQHEIINEVSTEVVNNVVNDITNNNVNIAEAVADSSSTAVASATADAYAEPHPAENAKQTESTPTVSTADNPTDESEQESEEEASTVEPCDANATYLAGIKYHEKMQAVDVQKKLVTIEEYVRFIMAPFIEDKFMDDLWKELRAFVENPTYEPNPFTQFKVKLLSFDVKHIIWNIATRLGYGKGQPYNSENCAIFIKALFPSICMYNGVPMDISSLQNLTITSPNENIHLDQPNPKRFGFHIPGQLGEEN